MKTAFEKDQYRFTIFNTTTEISSHKKLIGSRVKNTQERK